MRSLIRSSMVLATTALLGAAAPAAWSQDEVPSPDTAAAETASTNPRVVLETSKGRILAELFADTSPKTVENFLAYVDAGFFDGTIFHRVIPGFMVQGGGFTPEMDKKPTREGIVNESDNGLQNLRGTFAMARTPNPHSATAQFFINSVDNHQLDHPGSPGAWGYAVFGKVVEGMETVDAISAVPTGSRNGMRDVPVEPVIIEKISRYQPVTE